MFNKLTAKTSGINADGHFVDGKLNQEQHENSDLEKNEAVKMK